MDPSDKYMIDWILFLKISRFSLCSLEDLYERLSHDVQILTNRTAHKRILKIKIGYDGARWYWRGPMVGNMWYFMELAMFLWMDAGNSMSKKGLDLVTLGTWGRLGFESIPSALVSGVLLNWIDCKMLTPLFFFLMFHRF